MELLLNENDSLKKQLVESMKRNCKAQENESHGGYSNMLNILIECAKTNADKKAKGKRYSEVMKELGTLIFILGGLHLYQIFSANLPLPSVTTIRKKLSSTERLIEGHVRLGDLKAYLSRRGLDFVVWISEDATAIAGRVQYDSKTNQLAGFVPKLNQNGLPVLNSFPATSAEKIESYFKSGVASRNAYCIMAQPLAPNAPAFCIALFGTDSKFQYSDVLKRWEFIARKAKEEGIRVLGYSSDGDPKLLKAMQIKSLSSQPTKWPWFFPASFNPTAVTLQDIIHIIIKLKTRFLKPSGIYPLGNYFVISRGHIVDLLTTCSKDLHELTSSCLNPKDKMNFRAAQRLCDVRVTELLRCYVKDSDATAVNLDMTRDIMSSFLDHGLTPLERIEKIWQWVFFLRFWKKWITDQKGYTLGHNFVTSNTYMCIEVNAHGLIQVIHILRESEQPHLFLPHLFSSQSCEDFFRYLRSLSTLKSSITTFSILEMLYKVSRIDCLSALYKSLEGTLEFPQAQKAARKIEGMAKVTVLPEDYEIKEAVDRSFKIFLEICMKFGIAKAGGKPSPLTFNEVSLDDTEEDVDEEAATLEETEEYSNLVPNTIEPDPDAEHMNLVEDLCTVSTGCIGLKTYYDVNVTSDSPYVKVKDSNGNICIIRKSSLVWLLSSGDTKISSDRLLRVQASQVNHVGRFTPFSREPAPHTCRDDTVHVGDWCAFVDEGCIYIGKILAFSYMSGRTWKGQEYSALSATVTQDDGNHSREVGCLCHWYKIGKGGKLLPVNMHLHGFYSLRNYICTVSQPKVDKGQFYIHCSLSDIQKFKK